LRFLDKYWRATHFREADRKPRPLIDFELGIFLAGKQDDALGRFKPLSADDRQKVIDMVVLR
jgi:hypothetical protein